MKMIAKLTSVCLNLKQVLVYEFKTHNVDMEISKRWIITDSEAHENNTKLYTDMMRLAL